MVEQYRQGASLPALARAFGLHKRTIADHLIRQGVRPRYNVLSGEDLQAAAELYEEGYSLAAIGAKFRVSDCTISRALRKIGVTIRPRRGGRKRRGK